MIVNIISNITNGHGLQRDYEILREDLEALGHEVKGFQWDGVEELQFTNLPIFHADVNLFLEIFSPQLFCFADQNWFIPNPEYYRGQDLSRFDKILCKTGDAARIFGQWEGSEKVRFIGFRSRDLNVPEIQRQRKFLHAPGQNMFKGTDVIIEAWNKYAIEQQLTLVTPHEIYRKAASGNQYIDVLPRVTDDAHLVLMNLHQFHLCPARYEGWGHTLHEAMGVGAVVLSNLPIFGVGIHISARSAEKYNCVTLQEFSPEEIRDAVDQAWALRPDEISHASTEARKWFEHRTASFRENLRLTCA